MKHFTLPGYQPRLVDLGWSRNRPSELSEGFIVYELDDYRLTMDRSDIRTNGASLFATATTASKTGACSTTKSTALKRRSITEHRGEGNG